MDVGYTAFVEADNQEEAWSIARGEGLAEADWEQTDNGHCGTLENIWEAKITKLAKRLTTTM